MQPAIGGRLSYLNGSTKCLALPRCSTMRRCAAAFLGFLSKVVGFRFCLLLGVCFGATVVRWSGGFRKLVFGSRRKRACKRWVRVTLKGRIVRHSLPVKGKHSWRPMMRVLCLVRKVLEKFTAPRVRCKAEAQWTPEAERVVHRSRMLAGLPVEISVESEDELLPDPEQKPKPLNPEDPDPRPSPSGLSPPEDLEVPVYITSERLRAHRNKGHQPYLSFCDTCQSARGRVPARRRNMKSHYAPGELQVDFGFFGRNVRFLLVVHVLSGYLSTVVLGPEDPVPVPAICKALSEMGLNGLDIVVHGDQENLLESVFRDSAKHRTFVGRSMHWVPFAVNRPQAKGIVERNICLVKEAFWSVWLGLEERVGGQLPLGSHLFVEAMRYSVRMHNLFHVSKEQSTPLERLRGSTVQAVKSCEFGVVGFGKPQKDYPEHRGKRLVRAIYVGPQGANGSGIRVFVPLGDGKPPRLEIFSSFRARDPVEFDKAVLDQLKGNREDPERPIKFECLWMHLSLLLTLQRCLMVVLSFLWDNQKSLELLMRWRMMTLLIILLLCLTMMGWILNLPVVVFLTVTMMSPWMLGKTLPWKRGLLGSMSMACASSLMGQTCVLSTSLNLEMIQRSGLG